MTKVSKPADLSRELRKALGDLTQAELAARLLVSRNYISQIEAELKSPSARLLEQMGRLLTEAANADKESIRTSPVRTHQRASIVSEDELQALYGDTTPSQLRISIRALFERSLGMAGDDLGKLGWIREQLRANLQPPTHWVRAGSNEASDEALSRLLAEMEEKAAQHVRATGSENNPAVIAAKNRGRQRGFAKAAEILAQQVATPEHGSAAAKSG